MMRAMILAAGRGERMRPLTDHTPKPLLKVAGRPLIDWHLHNLARAGLRQVVVNHAWLGEKIRTYLGDGSNWNLEIRHSPEEQALETAGGIARALPWLGNEPFLVINGDVWTDWQASEAIGHAQRLLDSASHQAHLIMVPNPVQHPQGDFLLRDGLVQEPGAPLSATTQGDPTYTFSGIGIYKPAFFEGVPADKPVALAPLLRKAMQSGQILGSLYMGRWYDIGTRERLDMLDHALRYPG